MSPNSPKHDAIVIGAGFSGIRALWELDRLGLRVKCLEAGSDVGGAWYWNCYPGARTDSEAWVYAMNFTPDIREQWDYKERYPSQKEVQGYIRRVADHYNLVRYIQFGTRVMSARYSESDKTWTVTDQKGVVTTARYFIPATGPLSIAKEPLFKGLKEFTGEWYQAASWPKGPVSFEGKRIAVVGTGATGVQIIPKLASAATQLTVFQRTPNYVLPGRNYQIDESQAAEIKKNYATTLGRAAAHPYALAMTFSGKTIKDATDPDTIRRILDAGWESGGFHFQFETLDDLFVSPESNEIASDYIRQKIRSIVRDQATAEMLCPKYPFLSKRPPCGHFYYEAFNRPNVDLIDISHDEIELYSRGIRSTSGQGQWEFDMIIFALGFDAATGALSEIDVRGKEGQSLGDLWARDVRTFAGVLVPGFPNMFTVCGPHIPFGNMPVILDLQMRWIGKTIGHMNDNRLAGIEVSSEAASLWCTHLEETFRKTLFAASAKETGSWFVGANVPGKRPAPLFYFGSVQSWLSWLEDEALQVWKDMSFSILPV